MQHRNIATLGLSLALAATMTVPAFAADGLLISGNPNSYRYSITVNGEAVDTSALPNVDGLPVRLVAEADHGYASWYDGESTAYFNLTGGSFSLDFSDGSVSVGGEKVADTTLTIVNDTTFLPVSFFESLEGVDVTVTGNAVDITTPNNDPMVKLAYSLAETANLRGMKLNTENLEMNLGMTADNFTVVSGFAPMMISPDTLLIGKLAEGKEADAKAQWDAYVQNKYETHSWYLVQHLPKVEDARFEVENGYVICLIAENADETVAAFREAVKGL